MWKKGNGMDMVAPKVSQNDSEECLQKVLKNSTCSPINIFWLEITQGNAILQVAVRQLITFLGIRIMRF
nr:hypothetical protein [uncultured Prevotella sp.]